MPARGDMRGIAEEPARAVVPAGAADGWLDLADAIELLRDQVMEAQRRSRDGQVRFVLGEITLELEVELARARAVGGGLRFGVAEADARGERTSRAAHRVAIKLTPSLPDGGDVEVWDQG